VVAWAAVPDAGARRLTTNPSLWVPLDWRWSRRHPGRNARVQGQRIRDMSCMVAVYVTGLAIMECLPGSGSRVDLKVRIRRSLGLECRSCATPGDYCDRGHLNGSL
jgi:hypothetical protein